MAALPVVEVSVLADALNLEHTDAPRRVIVRGVETVRDALPMLAALMKNGLKFKGVADGGGGGQARLRRATTTATATTTSGTRTSSATPPPLTMTATLRTRGTDESSRTCNPFAPSPYLPSCSTEVAPFGCSPGTWPSTGLARRADLRHRPAAVLEARRPRPPPPAPRQRQGDPSRRSRGAGARTGELSVRLGNKVQKLVSHAFQDRHDKQQDQAQKLYLNYAVALD
ncbi:unnamed protein product [Urochloa humidicola]